ncbi:MAG: hypothetical protein KY468_02745 [Armatimonadetes bacterium]|nr:hypothetical protein [Armatimonadota bacterium]
MSSQTADDIYEEVVKRLPAAERLRLIERIAHGLAAPEEQRGGSEEAGEVALWRSASASVLQEVWDNDEDAAYDEL